MQPPLETVVGRSEQWMHPALHSVHRNYPLTKLDPSKTYSRTISSITTTELSGGRFSLQWMPSGKPNDLMVYFYRNWIRMRLLHNPSCCLGWSRCSILPLPLSQGWSLTFRRHSFISLNIVGIVLICVASSRIAYPTEHVQVLWFQQTVLQRNTPIHHELNIDSPEIVLIILLDNLMTGTWAKIGRWLWTWL